MTTVFIVIWCAYTAHALCRNACARNVPAFPGHVLQFILLAIAIWWAARSGLLSRALWSPVDIALGLALGHFLFAMSLMITHQHAGDVARHLVDLRGIGAFMKQSPELVFRFAGVCIIEELVYRAAAQDILTNALGRPVPAILLTAVSFCILHQHFFKNGRLCAFEFFLFSLAIGMVYYYTYSLTIVTLAHLARNVESAYLEYCVLLEEDNEPEQAMRILKKQHASSAAEFP